jgi:hypothetical protein
MLQALVVRVDILREGVSINEDQTGLAEQLSSKHKQQTLHARSST